MHVGRNQALGTGDSARSISLYAPEKEDVLGMCILDLHMTCECCVQPLVLAFNRAVKG